MTAPTLNGLAYSNLAIARDDLVSAMAAITIGDNCQAVDTIAAIIRQLEAARALLH